MKAFLKNCFEKIPNLFASNAPKKQEKENSPKGNPENYNPIESDCPLKEPDSDKLNRKDFCESLARTLAHQSDEEKAEGKESLVIGINGSWGSGKTTIKNFTKYYLQNTSGKEKTQAPKPYIEVDFNPWEWSRKDQLLQGFIESLSDGLNGNKKKKKIRKKLLALLSAFEGVVKKGLTWLETTLIAIVSGSIGGGGITTIFLYTGTIKEYFVTPDGTWKLLSIAVVGAIIVILLLLFCIRYQKNKAPESLASLRSDVEKDLIAEKKPIIIFIDDIDRLTQQEICILFQWLKTNLRLKNLTFVLFYQRDIVVHALDQNTGGKGNDYIRKIIQAEIDIPQVPKQALIEILDEKIKEVLHKNPDSTLQRTKDFERYQSLLEKGISTYIQNLRDVKRFLSSFQFYFQLHFHKGYLEVDFIDLIAIETLRVFENRLYQHIRNSQNFRCFLNPLTRKLGFKEDPQKICNELQEELLSKRSDDANKQALKAFLAKLFPFLNNPKYDGSSENHPIRIFQKDAFSRYFEFRVSPEQCYQYEINSFIHHLSDLEKTKDCLQAIDKSNRTESLLDNLTNRLKDIPINNIEHLLIGLFDLVENYPETSRDLINFSSRYGFGLDYKFTISYQERSTNLIDFKLRDQDPSKNQEILEKAYCETYGILVPTYFINRILINKKEQTSSSNTSRGYDPPFDLKPLQNEIFKKLDTDPYQNGKFFDHPRFGYIFSSLFIWNQAKAKKWLRENLSSNDPSKISQGIEKLLEYLYEEPSDGVGSFSLEAKVLDDWIPLEWILEKAETLSQENWSEKAKKAFPLLQKAEQYKKEGKDYQSIADETEP